MATVIYEITNNDTVEYVEIFKGKEVRIPAGKSITMPKAEANQFISTMALNEKGRLKNKKLSSKRVTPVDDSALICNFCGKEDFKNRDEFLLHLNTHASHRYSDKELDKKNESAMTGKIFSCWHCDFQCNDGKVMEEHIESHSETSSIPEVKKDGSNTSTGKNTSKSDERGKRNSVFD